jgi:hypothetical protein
MLIGKRFLNVGDIEALLSALGAIYPSDAGLITFNIDNTEPCLPPSVAF